ncbi:hypothetical protein [Protofrankia symbiont of Coriaria ruscifolia]|uniref:hypothetical protein n=1 Tax=Protofrankia symbiont of Coriaria ruscifolia TaxID=1306542 RepID=UPI00104129ED|nr:hypothetical protein [Protofrankia symbiont of Coriaria ruscifolia]
MGGGRWALEGTAALNPDVEVLGTRRDLAEYLTTLHPARATGHPGVRLRGGEREISRFLDAIAAFPQPPQGSTPSD